MDSHIEYGIVSEYINSLTPLQQTYKALCCQEDFVFFLKKWQKYHTHMLIYILENENTNLHHIKELTNNMDTFLRKRRAMISVFIQKIKSRENQGKFKKELTLFPQFISHHDEVFKIFLSKIMDRLSQELVHAQMFRKASTAYLQTPFFTGGN